MKKYNLLITLGAIFLLWLSLAFACKSDNGRANTSPIPKRTPIPQPTQTTKITPPTQTGIGKPFGARDPSKCAVLNPISGAPSTQQAAEYVACTLERLEGNQLFLLDEIIVQQVGSPRQYDNYKDRIGWRIDATKPVYPISGSFKEYKCDEVNNDEQNAGKNCFVMDHANAKGICFITDTGDWKCDMTDLGAKFVSNQAAPPR